MSPSYTPHPSSPCQRPRPAAWRVGTFGSELANKLSSCCRTASGNVSSICVRILSANTGSFEGFKWTLPASIRQHIFLSCDHRFHHVAGSLNSLDLAPPVSLHLFPHLRPVIQSKSSEATRHNEKVSQFSHFWIILNTF